MAGVYLDEDVWLPLAGDLRTQGHEVAIYRDHLPSPSSDALHLLTATQQGRILITFNRTAFRLLHAAWQYWTVAWGVAVEHAGIIVGDQTVPRATHAGTIHSLLTANLPFANQLYEWRGGTTGGWHAYGQRRSTPISL